MVTRKIRFGVAFGTMGLVVGGGIVATRRANELPIAKQVLGIPEGSSIILSSDHLDFRGTSDATPSVRRMLLRNAGSVRTHVRIENPSGYVVDPAELELVPGQIGRVTVTAGPRAAANGQLRIFADGSATPLVVTLDRESTDAAESAIAQNEAGEVDEPIALTPRTTENSFTPPQVGPVGPSGEPMAPVEIARALDLEDAGGSAVIGDSGTGAPPMSGAPSQPTTPPAPRSISDPPSGPRSTDPPMAGERPEPVDPKPHPRDSSGDPTEPSEPQTTPTFAVSPASTLQLFGSANSFYPQQVGISGFASGGSFRLASSLELPRIPLAFGESIGFRQSAAASGAFNPSSGQVTLNLPLEAVDGSGNAAPVLVSLTTGTVLGRTNEGVLISVTGQPRAQDSGQLRLVGIGKIPSGYGNGAEEELVTLQVLGTLTFPDVTLSEVVSGSDGSGN